MGVRWTIYCHTHIESGRRYIGLTKMTMMQRWNRHIYNAKSSKGGRWHFSNAIRKYGKDAFSHEILEICYMLEEANATEEKWIEFYDTRNPEKGFNLTKGGEHQPHPIKNPWDRPEYREKATEASRKTWQTPEVLAKASSNSRKLWQDPVFRSRVISAIRQSLQDPASRVRMSEASKKIWQDPELRKKASEFGRLTYSDPVVKDHCIKAMIASFATPESKAKRSASSKALWQSEEFRAKYTELWKDPNYRAKLQVGIIKGATINKNKTHCPHGHEYSEENTLVNNRGSRECRSCLCNRSREAYRKRRMAKTA